MNLRLLLLVWLALCVTNHNIVHELRRFFRNETLFMNVLTKNIQKKAHEIKMRSKKISEMQQRVSY